MAADFVEGLKLDFETGALETTEHARVGVQLGESGEEEGRREVEVPVFCRFRRLQRVHVHVMLDETCNKLVATVHAPDGGADASVIREMLSTFSIDGSAEGLATVVVDVVLFHRLHVRAERQEKVEVEPVGQPPFHPAFSDQVLEPGRDGFTMLENGLPWRLAAGRHSLAERLKFRGRYLRSNAIIGANLRVRLHAASSSWVGRRQSCRPLR